MAARYFDVAARVDCALVTAGLVVQGSEALRRRVRTTKERSQLLRALSQRLNERATERDASGG
jgi:hypothetical protein